MADQKNAYKVLRRHEGDRFYEEGDTREGTAAELGHLVPNVLELIGPVKAEKAEAKPKNKALPAAPANKAVTTPGRKSKGK